MDESSVPMSEPAPGAAPEPEARGLPAVESQPFEPVPPSVVDGRVRRLNPANISAERFTGWIVTAVLTAGAVTGWTVVLFVNDLALWINVLIGLGALTLLVLFATLLQIWPPIEWRHTSYRADQRGIEIRRGVVWRSVTSVPRARIQHIDVTQGPVQRRYGLATLVLNTAGSENSQVSLAGLSRPTALGLRDALSGERGGDAV